MVLAAVVASAKSTPPKREFRGVWVATVSNLDWPSSRSGSPATQMQELSNLFDYLKNAGVNAILFQVRPECDALYNSNYEPWSYYLTGLQGMAPSPYYDPLTFAVEEAHKRGMELHAWFNPYRAVRSVGSYSISSKHVSILHPDWILYFSAIKLKLLDPGLPAVREYVARVVMDVVRRYDVDGVHFDDYFYPYPGSNFSGITNEDDLTFAAYSRGFSDRADWRRDNVNLLVRMVHDSIACVKPWVKFGISPFGIWKPGVPAGISGTSAYDQIYCDATAWLQAQTVDYLTPQLYWPSGGGQDYTKLVSWWASLTNGRHLYPGQAAYRIVNWSATEVPSQIRLNRRTAHCGGSVFFRAKDIRDNPRGFTDSLRSDLYRYPAIQPAMTWQNDIPPGVPQKFKYARSGYTTAPELSWEAPEPAADGETASRYIVYRHAMQTPGVNYLEDPSAIIMIGTQTSLTPVIPVTSGPFYYTVTALDRYNNESSADAMIYVPAPGEPLLAYPADGSVGYADTVRLRWHRPSTAVVYELQVDDAIDFTTLVANKTNWSDSTYILTGLAEQRQYYWRVRSANAGGWGAFSEVRAFRTGAPVMPLLAYPPNDHQAVPVDAPLAWKPVPGAESYHVQLARAAAFDSSNLVKEVSGIRDTLLTGLALDWDQVYYWRVQAGNRLGIGPWSAVFTFKTAGVTEVADRPEIRVEEKPPLPLTVELQQNYPNPFNGATIIPFEIPRDGPVRLLVYDMLGRKIAVLANEFYPAGHHAIEWAADDSPSGVYVYRLFYENRIITKRMLMVR